MADEQIVDQTNVDILPEATIDTPVEEVKATAEVVDAPIEANATVADVVADQPLPPEYVEAGNTIYSGTSEMGKDVGRGYDDSNDK